MFSLITLAATAPLLATSTLQLQETAQNTSDKNSNGNSGNDIKTEKCHFRVRATARTTPSRSKELQGMMVFLHDGTLRLRPEKESEMHPFTGYFLPYPDTPYDGLVTTINQENMLNWTYIDRETYAVKYGVRAASQPHLTVPMKLSHLGEEARLTFNKFEGFLAVEEAPDDWALYFDKDDNGLKNRMRPGTRVTEIELVRVPTENRDDRLD